jgi:sugar/nucleoside kinase (ribokinase family)
MKARASHSHARRGIAAGGNWIIDHIKLVDRWPHEETLALIHSVAHAGGGCPHNVLVGLARFGAGIPLEAIGLVGDDADGRFLLGELKRHGVDARQMRVTRKAPTSYTDVMSVRATGRRTFFHDYGANALLDADAFDFRGTNAKIFLLGYLLLLDRLDRPDPRFGTVAARVLAAAHRAGLKVAVDVVSEVSVRAPGVVLPALRHCDYCILNEVEAGCATGITIMHGDQLNPQNLKRAARKLLEGGVRELVCIHLREGGYAITPAGREVFQPSLRLPASWIKGAAGAGDAFNAGMLHGLHEEWDLQRCLRLAVCAAAACLNDPTTTGGMRQLQPALALAERFGFRRSVL